MQKLEIPEGVQLSVEANKLKVQGPKGTAEKEIKGTKFSIKMEGNTAVIESTGKMMENTIKAHISNLIIGVTEGYERKMKMLHAHFPMTFEVKGNTMYIKNFLGERKPRKAKVVGDAKVSVKGQFVTISALNKEYIGQTVANIREATKVKKKDVRIFQDGIYLTGD